LYAARSEFDKARAALEAAVRANPAYAIAHENLGDVYARLAAISYAKAQQLDPADSSAARKLALVRQLFPAPPQAK
jgi:tetratricopeptide (TPR) repeat protein